MHIRMVTGLAAVMMTTRGVCERDRAAPRLTPPRVGLYTGRRQQGVRLGEEA
jgi:hypothetical protein